MGLTAKNPYEDDEPVEATRAGEPELPVVELVDVDHVALAVEDLDEALDDHRDAFGLTVDHREVLDEEGVEVAVLRVGGTELHLVSPVSDDSWLVELLEVQGPGLSHLGYRVADCEAALAELGARGYELVDEEPRRGVAGARVAYVHPPGQPGTLIQLVERT